MKFINGVIILLGLWEAGDIAAFFTPGFGSVPVFVVNHILTGLLLVTAGAWAALTRNAHTARWLHWTAAIAGAWLVAAALLLRGTSADAGLWNDGIVGGLALLLGVWAVRKNLAY